MSWQPYLSPTATKGPFLLARLASWRESSGRAVYLDARLDTGSARSCVPRVAIEECQRAGISLVAGARAWAAGVFDGEHALRETYWFRLTLCPAPAVRASLSDDFLRRHFSTAHPLYPPADALRGADRRGLEMPVTERSYVLIGQDVLAHWTVIFHGRSSHFKVMDRSGKWFIFSLAPR